MISPDEDDLVAGREPERLVAAPAIDVDAVRQRYISAIGPIGGALFDEAVEEIGDELSKPAGARQLIEKLVEQIDDEAEAASFRNDVGV